MNGGGGSRRGPDAAAHHPRAANIKTARRIAIIGVWFGPWPSWIDFFLISCRANRGVDWIIFTDQDTPDSTPSNVNVTRIAFPDYVNLIEARLSIKLHKQVYPYKMNDFKPALAHIHYSRIRCYDFVGFTDLDVIYGDIRSIYTDDVLSTYDALSTHTTHLSGHLFLMKNNIEMREAFLKVQDWRSIFEQHMYCNFDENSFFKYLKYDRRVKIGLASRRRPVLFRETYSTPMPTSDMRWYWKDGLLSNEFYPKQFFLYLHFMAWQSSKWYPVISYVSPGTAAPWENRSDVVQIDWRTAEKEGFMISPAGIQAIEVRPYP